MFEAAPPKVVVVESLPRVFELIQNKVAVD